MQFRTAVASALIAVAMTAATMAIVAIYGSLWLLAQLLRGLLWPFRRALRG